MWTLVNRLHKPQHNLGFNYLFTPFYPDSILITMESANVGPLTLEKAVEDCQKNPQSFSLPDTFVNKRFLPNKHFFLWEKTEKAKCINLKVSS